MQHGQGWIHVDGGFGGQLTDFFYGNFCERFFFEQFQKCVPAIYIKEFVDVCDEMTRRYDNPLYIPEEEFSDVQAYLFGVDTGDAALKVPQDLEEYGWYNRTMKSMMPLLVSRYGTDGLQAVCSERKEEDTRKTSASKDKAARVCVERFPKYSGEIIPQEFIVCAVFAQNFSVI